MNITILDDYQNVIKNLKCFEILQGQSVQILHVSEKNIKVLAEKLSDTNILVLIRERFLCKASLNVLKPYVISYVCACESLRVFFFYRRALVLLINEV